MNDFADKVRSIGFVSDRGRQKRRDVRDQGGRLVGVAADDDTGATTTTYDDRQDVTVRPSSVHVVSRINPGGAA